MYNIGLIYDADGDDVECLDGAVILECWRSQRAIEMKIPNDFGLTLC